ncbi:MAG: adenine phosphoribosyltransferase [Azoarcus sp.]|jgi:adenine phosphoribosyltransferase|nr:adenine phosphoribosyltransferase [Azoarcus sp.]
MPIKSRIRTVADFPKQGVVFRDITSLLKDATGFRITMHKLVNRYSGKKIHKVAAVESRGFIVGAPLAYALGAGFVPICRQGELPAETIWQDCESKGEFSPSRVEMRADAVSKGERILFIDDLLATGATSEAACALLRKAGAEILECAFIAEMLALAGRVRLQKQGLKVFALTGLGDDA